MNEQLNVLIVEDEMDIAANISAYLESQHQMVDFAQTVSQARACLAEQFFDVVVLDVNLPDGNGFDLCREIRENSARHIPIIMLTARDTLDDKLDGFDAGADDYLTKPFAMQELLVRCIALSRRHQLNTDHTMQLGELTIDRQAQQASRQGKPLTLNATPLNILTILAEAHPRVVPKSELISRIWPDEPTESDALRSHIYQLRQQLDKPFDTPMLKTMHGVGFYLDVPK